MKYTLRSLLKEAKEKNKQIGKLRIEVAQEKLKDEENESNLWVNTPFKEKGLTNDNMRKAYVKQQMVLMFPSFYASKKAKLENLEADLKWIYKVIDLMQYYQVDEIDLDENKKETKDNPK